MLKDAKETNGAGSLLKMDKLCKYIVGRGMHFFCVCVFYIQKH